jgi:hypothetical protein
MNDSSNHIHWLTYPCGAQDGGSTNLIANVTCADCLADIDHQRQQQESERERERKLPTWITIE